MLLRKITQHVTEQNWFAVFIDFLIVVVGVFIGIQVANWNEERTDRSKEQLYLTYLTEDLVNDINEINQVIQVTEWRISALAAVITTATGEAMPTSRATPGGREPIRTVPEYEEQSPKSVVMATSLLVTFDGSGLAYNTLVSTGGIRLIQNQVLARKMELYDAMVRDLQRIETRLTPYRDELTVALQGAGVAWIDPLGVAELAAVAKNDLQLLAAMKNFWAFNDWHLRSLLKTREIAVELQSVIRGE